MIKKFDELQLSKDLISFPSVTPVDAGAINYISKKLQQLGFNCKVLEFKDKKNPPIKNLYARLGNKQPNLCYAGHTDVVPAGNINDWTINPFKPSKYIYVHLCISIHVAISNMFLSFSCDFCSSPTPHAPPTTTWSSRI